MWVLLGLISSLFLGFYDVSKKDPELMDKLDKFQTIASFHKKYLSSTSKVIHKSLLQRENACFELNILKLNFKIKNIL